MQRGIWIFNMRNLIESDPKFHAQWYIMRIGHYRKARVCIFKLYMWGSVGSIRKLWQMYGSDLGKFSLNMWTPPLQSTLIVQDNYFTNTSSSVTYYPSILYDWLYAVFRLIVLQVVLTECFYWMSIFRHHSKWCWVIMMNFMYIFVISLIMKEPVSPVMPGVLNHQTDEHTPS